MPQSDVPGEQAWPTQPFPTNPPPFAQQSLTATRSIRTSSPPSSGGSGRRGSRRRATAACSRRRRSASTRWRFPARRAAPTGARRRPNPTNGIRLRARASTCRRSTSSTLERAAPGAGRGGPAGRGPAVARAGTDASTSSAARAATAPTRGRAATIPRSSTSRRGWPDDVLRDDDHRRPARRCRRAYDLTARARWTRCSRFLGQLPPGDPGAPAAADGAGRRRTRCRRARWSRAAARQARPHPAGRRRGHGRSGISRQASTRPRCGYYTGYGMQSTIVRPPYSTLTAYDLNTGTIKWQVPGRRRRAARDRGGRQQHRLSDARATGIITTADRPALPRRRSTASCAPTTPKPGRVLWIGDLPAGSVGVPAMYEANGKQYLLVSATQGGGGRGAAPARRASCRAARVCGVRTQMTLLRSSRTAGSRTLSVSGTTETSARPPGARPTQSISAAAARSRK